MGCSPSQSNRQVSRDFSHVYSQGARRAKVSARGPADSDNLCKSRVIAEWESVKALGCSAKKTIYLSGHPLLRP